MNIILRTTALAALAASAPAGDVSVPSGFDVETDAQPALVAGQLLDGTVLYATGSFGADELSVLDDGTLVPFATGFGSIAGVAQSPVTGEIVVGDSFPGRLWLLDDANGDGDALDAGEKVLHPAPFPTPAGGGEYLPFDLAFEPGTDDLFVSYSTFGSDPFEGGIFRVADDVLDDYATGYGFAAGLLFDDGELFAADLDEVTFAGRIVRLVDGNDDGDALDAGEQTDFASGLNGASGLVRDDSGAFYLSGTFAADFSTASVTRLVDTNDDDVADVVDPEWATGFGFTGGLLLVEGAAGFVPGADGDGALTVTDFAATTVPRTIRTGPLADTGLTGTIQSDTTIEIAITGAPDATGVWVLSLDTTAATVPGVGDICVGFSQPHVVSPMLPLGASGTAVTQLVLRDLSAVAGLDVALQAFTFEDGRIGIGDALVGAVGP